MPEQQSLADLIETILRKSLEGYAHPDVAELPDEEEARVYVDLVSILHVLRATKTA